MPTNKYSRTLDTLQEFLRKARRRLSDENPDVWEQADEEEYSPEEDLSEQDEDAADAWLKENDPSINRPRDEYDFDEPSDDEQNDAHEDEPEEAEEPELSAPPPKKAAGPMVRRRASEAAPSSPPPPAAAPTSPAASPVPPSPAVTPPAAAPARESRRMMVRPSGVTAAPGSTSYDARSEDALQPTREELIAMRAYTRPWEQRARDRSRLEARPDVNPLKHQHGRLMEARSLSHADKNKAYEDFTNSPEYQDADPITQMEMDAKFHSDWHSNNPDHFKSALQAHSEAYKKGASAREFHAKAKDEKIRHIASGGAQPGAYSLEEGLQHIGGGREDDDASPSGITQDKSAAFAVGNQEFLDQYMKRYNQRAKTTDSGLDLDAYNAEARADIEHVLGQHSALKDPAKQAKMNQFVSRYYPQIEKAKWRVINKLGLQDQVRSGQIDEGLLNFAGMHALFQAVNDYDHDHHSKAKFVTHLNRKMHGLMQTALKTQDEIPQEMRLGAKRFDQQKRAANAAPVKITDKHGNVRMVQPAAPPAPSPTPAAAPATPPPAPKPIAPVVRRQSHEIAASHPPEVQDRLKRVASAKQPAIRRGTDAQPKPPAPARNWNVRNVNLEDDGGDDNAY